MEQSGPKADVQLFELLSSLLQEVESISNQEEVELRSKIQALGLEVTKVPSKKTKNLDEVEIASELYKFSAKLDHADKMISSAMAADPEVHSLLSGTADVWKPVITASAEKRRNFSSSISDDKHKGQDPSESTIHPT